VTDLQPLVDNEGIGVEDWIDVGHNPLGFNPYHAARQIEDLQDRGVSVWYDEFSLIFDPNLQAAIRQELELGEYDELTVEDLEGLTSLDAGGRGILNIRGLEYCINLTDLNLADNYVNDLLPLAELTQLTSLTLSSNDVSDLEPLSNLVQLQQLDLYDNHIADLAPLSLLDQLESLTLWQNDISDISPLAGLASLTYLDLEANQISDIAALQYLPALETLHLTDNHISDLQPLVDNPGMDAGDVVYVGDNPLGPDAHDSQIPALQEREVIVEFDAPSPPVAIADGALEQALRDALDKPSGPLTEADLAGLAELNADGYGIADLSGIEQCVNLTTLHLGDNAIGDLSPLAEMPQIEVLVLWGNAIEDASPLAGLTNLSYLDLDFNHISDLSPLSGLENIEFLLLWDNDVEDLSPLANLTLLSVLDLAANRVSDLSPLAGLTALEVLSLNENDISDLQPLMDNAGLGDGTAVYLFDNPLDVVSRAVHIPALETRGVWVYYDEVYEGYADVWITDDSGSSNDHAAAFGVVEIGQSGTCSFHVRNTGGSPLVISGLALVGADRQQFAAAILGGQPAGSDARIVAPGDSVIIRATYSPAAAGSHSAAIMFTAGGVADGEIVYLLQLSGETPAVGELTGRVWEDGDGDGAWGAGESPLGGAIVFIDADADGHRDPGEAMTSSASDGSFTFAGLTEGTYTVRVEAPTDWQITAPGGGAFVAAVVAQQSVDVGDFGLYFETAVPQPDLEVAVTSSASLEVFAGELLRFDYRLFNLGDADAGSFLTRLYVSETGTAGENSQAVMASVWGEGMSAGGQADDYFSLQAATAPGTYYYAICVDDAGAVDESDESNNWSGVVTVDVLPSPTPEYRIADYFPLAGGLVRTYENLITAPNGKVTDARAISMVVPGTTQIGSVAAQEVRQYLDGRHERSTYYSTGSHGLELYRQEYPYRKTTACTEFVGGLQMAPAVLEEGETYYSAAPWQGSQGSWSGSYTQELTVVGLEQVVLPYGVFTALRLDFVVDAVKVGADEVVLHDEYSVWMVEGVGVVRQAGTWGEARHDGPLEQWQFEYRMLSYGQANDEQLRGDLVVRFAGAAVPSLVPGQALNVPVVVENVGAARIEGDVTVALYAQGVTDGSRVLLIREEGVRVNLNPAQSTNVSLDFVVPDDLPEGEYLLVAAVDVDEAVSELDEANNESFVAVSAELVYLFGNIYGGGRASLTLEDVNGTPVTFDLSGDGHGEVVRGENGRLDVYLYGTDSRSTLKISSPRHADAVINDIHVVREQGTGEEFIGGSLGKIDAPTTDLLGDIHCGDGSLGSIVLDVLAGGQVIEIGADETGRSRGVNIAFGSVGDVSVYSAMPISSLTAIEWLDTDATGDQIVAPALGRLRITGGCEALGHFGADLLLDGQDVAKRTLGRADIAGDLYGATWDITGDMGRLTVGGIAEDARIRTSGSMDAIKLGAAVGSDFLAGVADVGRHAGSFADFVNLDARIASVNIIGVTLEGAEVDPYFFEDSNFSAADIGRVNLLNLFTDNDDEQFGFFAAAGGKRDLGPIRHRDTVTGEQWIWPKDEGEVDLLDFAATIFAEA